LRARACCRRCERKLNFLRRPEHILILLAGGGLGAGHEELYSIGGGGAADARCDGFSLMQVGSIEFVLGNRTSALSVAEAAAPKSNVSVAMHEHDSAGAAQASDPDPTLTLFYTLVAIFVLIIVGFLPVRLKWLSEADLKALDFFTSKIAFPIIIFKTVATAQLGTVNFKVTLACTVGKAVASVSAWILTFNAYDVQRPLGKRVLSATVFGFFVVAANEFAVGFPVIDALYGDTTDMKVYITANALVGSVFFVPVTMFLFAVGQSLDQAEGDQASKEVPTTCSFLLGVGRDALLNPVISCTIVGLVFQLLLGQRYGDVLPPPLSNVSNLFDNFFSASALLLTGASMRLDSVGAWPVMLVLMKVIICAYVSFLFGAALITSTGELSDVLRNFTFFYGLIPSSSAPLVFASQFSPEVAELVATAVFLGLALAGPIMFTTALFIEAPKGSSKDQLLGSVQLVCVSISLLFAAFASALLGFVRSAWDRIHSKRQVMLLGYALVLIVYEVMALFNNPEINPHFCESYITDRYTPMAVAICWIQNVARFLVLALQFETVRSTGLPSVAASNQLRSGAAAIALCIVLGCCPAFIVLPNTVNEICNVVGPTTWSSGSLWPNLIWNTLLLVTTVVLAFWGICSKPQVADGKLYEALPALEPASAADALPDDGELKVSEATHSITEILVAAQAVRFLMQVVNTYIVAVHTRGVLGSGTAVAGSFAQALVLENILEHSQLVVLVLAFIAKAGVLGREAGGLDGSVPGWDRQVSPLAGTVIY